MSRKKEQKEKLQKYATEIQDGDYTYLSYETPLDKKEHGKISSFKEFDEFVKNLNKDD